MVNRTYRLDEIQAFELKPGYIFRIDTQFYTVLEVVDNVDHIRLALTDSFRTSYATQMSVSPDTKIIVHIPDEL